MGGTFGAIATGLWASSAVNPAVTVQGLFISGERGLLAAQVAAGGGSLLCLAITGAVTGGLRVDEDDEFAGLDLSQHSENAYLFGSGGYGSGLGSHGARPASEVRTPRTA